MDSIYEQLLEYANSLEVVDAHEHLISEAVHIKKYLSFYHYFAAYVQWDLYSAGMPKEMVWVYPENEEDEKRYFDVIEPLWQFVKYSSYARPVRLAFKEFYGFDDLTRENFLEIGRMMNHYNYTGRYDEVFDKARIKYILNQSSDHSFNDPRFVYVRPIQYFNEKELREFFQANPNSGLKELTEQLEINLKLAKAKGATGAKVFSANFTQPPDQEKAKACCDALKKGQKIDLDPLYTVLYDETVALCGKYGLVAAIHTGVWTDLNKQKPELVFPIVERHPDTIFDVYHMGMPYVGACAFLGKSYPNVNLNLCWAHNVSEKMALSALDEWLDLVPLNKIIGFGGDIITIPEHIWGQVQHARENLARALAFRIERDRLDLNGGKQILKLWLYDNPIRIYKITDSLS